MSSFFRLRDLSTISLSCLSKTISADALERPRHPRGEIPFTHGTKFTLHILRSVILESRYEPDQFQQLRNAEVRPAGSLNVEWIWSRQIGKGHRNRLKAALGIGKENPPTTAATVDRDQLQFFSCQGMKRMRYAEAPGKTITTACS